MGGFNAKTQRRQDPKERSERRERMVQGVLVKDYSHKKSLPYRSVDFSLRSFPLVTVDKKPKQFYSRLAFLKNRGDYEKSPSLFLRELAR